MPLSVIKIWILNSILFIGYSFKIEVLINF